MNYSKIVIGGGGGYLEKRRGRSRAAGAGRNQSEESVGKSGNLKGRCAGMEEKKQENQFSGIDRKSVV